MRNFISRKNSFMVVLVILLFSSTFVFSAGAKTKAKNVDKLPGTMFWSCYDVGSSGYTQASAIATAFTEKYGTRIRLLPSGTSIGRIIPVVTKRVDVGFLANEVYFAVEGIYDFSSIEWGPQDLRLIFAHPTTIAMATTKTSGIKTLRDLKGKRVAWIPGAPTLNVKTTAFLAFADLTWNDVRKVEFSSYASSLRALINGTVDTANASTTASIMYELETCPRGVYWPPVPPDDKTGWKRMQKIAPFLSPYQETIGAGITKEKPVWLAHYRYPMITVPADADEQWVYNFAKAMDEAFSLYKDVNAVMPLWRIGQSGVPPADAPFHKGAIRYLKEKGIWTAKDDVWNKNRIEHLKKVQRAWNKATKEAEVKKIKSKKFPEFWLKERAKALEK